MVCLSRPYHFKFFKGCLRQILLGPFLNTLTHLFLNFIILMAFLLQTYIRNNFNWVSKLFLRSMYLELWLQLIQKNLLKMFLQSEFPKVSFWNSLILLRYPGHIEKTQDWGKLQWYNIKLFLSLGNRTHDSCSNVFTKKNMKSCITNWVMKDQRKPK